MTHTSRRSILQMLVAVPAAVGVFARKTLTPHQVVGIDAGGTDDKLGVAVTVRGKIVRAFAREIPAGRYTILERGTELSVVSQA